MALLLALNVVNGMIIKKEMKHRPQLKNKSGVSRLERKLIDEIVKEKEKNNMLKNMLKNQENLSKELDQKIQSKDGNEAINSKKADNAATQKNVKINDKKSVDNNRELKQTKSDNSNLTKNKAVSTVDGTEKTVNKDNRKLNQSATKQQITNNKSNSKIDVAINSKSKSLPVNNKSEKPDLNDINEHNQKSSRKLTGSKPKAWVQTRTFHNTSSRANSMRKAAVKRVTVQNKHLRAIAPNKAANMRFTAKRQLKAKPSETLKSIKKLAAIKRNNIVPKFMAKNVPVNQVNTKRVASRHYNDNNIAQINHRKLGQTKPTAIVSNKNKSIKTSTGVNTNQKLNHSVNKPAAKRQLSHVNSTPQKTNGGLNRNKLKKAPVRWTKKSRKLVGKPTKSRRSNRILDEANEAEEYPVKLMNASISYPILGMVNLGSGEYDLNIS